MFDEKKIFRIKKIIDKYRINSSIKRNLRNESKALKVKEFIENLEHSKGIYAGKPFILEDWQYKDIIRPLYGTLNPDGTRQYRIFLIMVAKKNGKTTLAAALALYLKPYLLHTISLILSDSSW